MRRVRKLAGALLGGATAAGITGVARLVGVELPAGVSAVVAMLLSGIGTYVAPANESKREPAAGQSRVGEELRYARTRARQDDPGWARWYWPAFLIITALGFAVPEAVAIASPRKADTLSERMRAWLGIEPSRKRRRWAWSALTLVLVVFTIWFPAHLMQWWPWEG